MAYKYVNPEGLEHLINSIKNKFVQKVTGKDLSTNDFTNSLKGKLDGIEAGAQVNSVEMSDLTAHTTATGNVHDIPNASTAIGGLMTKGDKAKLNDIADNAQVNVIELIKRNGTNISIDANKAVDIDVPVRLTQLTNDASFQTDTQVLALIAEHGRLKKEIVATLPDIANADDNTMYLVASDNGFSEWMVINEQWEQLGDTSDIDLTQYVRKTDLVPITTAEIDALWIA
jgi:hypothetical protein